MVSEDETFRILSRTPFPELRNLYVEWYKTNLTWSQYLDWFKERGWTYREFKDYHTKNGIPLPHD